MAEKGSSGRTRIIRAALFFFLVMGLFGCDHATKFAAKASLENAAAVPIASEMLRGAVELRYAENDDVAFSALRALGVPRSPTLLIGLEGLAIVAMALFVFATMRRSSLVCGAHETSSRGALGHDGSPALDRATRVGLALVFGGALGNLVDRIARGYVVDFIHVRGWPIFNVADIAVVAGVILVVLARSLRRRVPAPS